jgi:hypothetical protein
VVRIAGQDAVAKKKGPYPCQESNPVRPARSLITILTELLRFYDCIKQYANRMMSYMITSNEYVFPICVFVLGSRNFISCCVLYVSCGTDC